MDKIECFKNEYRFLSNFYIVHFSWEGFIWSSSESAYQAAKSVDKTLYPDFSRLTPSESKKLGRRLVLREDWEYIKFDIMKDILFNKFSQNALIKKYLIDTNNAILEEGNHWNDRIWGVSPVGSGNGENNLGKILMNIRKELCEISKNE